MTINKSSLLFRSGFLNLGIVDILGWKILYYEGQSCAL